MDKESENSDLMYDYYRERGLWQYGEVNTIPACVVTGQVCRHHDCRECVFAQIGFAKGISGANNYDKA